MAFMLPSPIKQGSRAGCHAAVAVSAAVVDRLIRLNVQIGDELSQKHIGAKFLGDDQAVLADEADSCSLGYGGIDQGAVSTQPCIQNQRISSSIPIGKPVQLVLQT